MNTNNPQEFIAQQFVQNIPHNRDLHTEVVEAGHGFASLRIPYDEKLLGDPDRRLIHTGVITSLIDAASGVAVLCSVAKMQPIATLDLRVDYLRPAVAGKPITVRAECYRMTAQIAFVRATAYQDDPELPVADASATFMLNSTGRKRQSVAA